MKSMLIIVGGVALLILIMAIPGIAASVHGSNYLKSETKKPEFIFYSDSATVADECLTLINPTYNNDKGTKIEVYGRGLAAYLRTDINYINNTHINVGWTSIIKIGGDKFNISSYNIIKSNIHIEKNQPQDK